MKLKSYIISFCILFSFQFIQAQENSNVQRRGFVFGASAGIANSIINYPNQSDQFSDLALDFKIGYMIKSNLALLLTSNVSIYDYSGFGRDRKREFGVLAPTVQYWLPHKLWIQGGIGIGGDNPVFWDIKNPDEDELETKYYSGLGLITALGYEIYQSENHFIVDLKLKAMYRKVTIQEGQTSGFSYGLLIGISMY